MKTVGVIGGSGLYNIEGLSDVESVSVDTPGVAPLMIWLLVTWVIPGWYFCQDTAGDTK